MTRTHKHINSLSKTRIFVFILLSVPSKQCDISYHNCEQINAKHKRWKREKKIRVQRKSWPRKKRVYSRFVPMHSQMVGALCAHHQYWAGNEKVRWNRKFGWCAVIKSRQKERDGGTGKKERKRKKKKEKHHTHSYIRHFIFCYGNFRGFVCVWYFMHSFRLCASLFSGYCFGNGT